VLVALGDNAARSSDSHQWGYVRADQVLGVVRRSFGSGGHSRTGTTITSTRADHA
jgi:hypothetical protein